MPVTPDQLLERLATLGIAVTTVRHPPLHTVDQSRELRGEIAGGHTKNLFLRDRKDRHFLLTVAEDAEIDLKTVHHAIGASGRVSFGKPEALLDLLGVTPGAVTAFGVVNDERHQVEIVFDEALMRHEIINCHPLTNEATTSIAREDLLRFVASTGHAPKILKLSAQ